MIDVKLVLSTLILAMQIVGCGERNAGTPLIVKVENVGKKEIVGLTLKYYNDSSISFDKISPKSAKSRTVNISGDTHFDLTYLYREKAIKIDHVGYFWAGGPKSARIIISGQRLCLETGYDNNTSKVNAQPDESCPSGIIYKYRPL